MRLPASGGELHLGGCAGVLMGWHAAGLHLSGAGGSSLLCARLRRLATSAFLAPTTCLSTPLPARPARSQLASNARRLYGLNLCRGLGDKFLKDEDLGESALLPCLSS